MKYDIKYEIKDSKLLLSLIKNAYKMGVLCDKNQHFTFDSQTELFAISIGLNNIFVRVQNENVIDGYLKTILIEDKENNVVKLFPVSLYCDYDADSKKYTFL
jgi:hypothetical protein